MAMKEERAQKKTQIIAAFQSKGDWRQVARDLNVPNSTAYRLISEGEVEDTCGGKKGLTPWRTRRKENCLSKNCCNTND